MQVVRQNQSLYAWKQIVEHRHFVNVGDSNQVSCTQSFRCFYFSFFLFQNKKRVVCLYMTQCSLTNKEHKGKG